MASSLTVEVSSSAHLAACSGNQTHRCHVRAADGFDLLNVFVAFLVHELGNEQEAGYSKTTWCAGQARDWLTGETETYLVEISDDLIEETQALHAHVVSIQLDVEVVEVGNGGEEHADLGVRLVVQILGIIKEASMQVRMSVRKYIIYIIQLYANVLAPLAKYTYFLDFSIEKYFWKNNIFPQMLVHTYFIFDYLKKKKRN